MSDTGQIADPFLPLMGLQRRVFACLRFLIFLLLVAGLLFALDVMLPRLPWPAHAYAWRLLIADAERALCVLAVTAAMARVGRRRMGDFGLGGTDRTRNFLIGIVSGLALLSLLLLGLYLASAFSLGQATATADVAVSYGVYYALVMLAVAFGEEGFDRGYALVALSEAISFWPAALVLALIFGLQHAWNRGETAVGLVAAGLFGMVIAYSFRRTRSLWFGYGFHASWDYGETFIFGLPNSGATLPGGLFHPEVQGPAWLTGGSAGPEGSALIFLVLAGAVLIIRNVLHPAATGVVQPPTP
jgi:membrane protease YdiL (CAAX protease family)